MQYIYTGGYKEDANLALECGIFDGVERNIEKTVRDALEVDGVFEEELQQSEETVRIAVETGHAMAYDGEPVAYIEYFTFDLPGLTGVVNTGLAVKKEYQKRGIATELTKKILKLLMLKGPVLYLHPGQGEFPAKFVKKLEKMFKGYRAGILLAGAIGHNAPGTYVAVLVPEDKFEEFSYEVTEEMYINPAKPPKVLKPMKALELYSLSELKEPWAKFDYSALPALVGGTPPKGV